MFDNNGNLIIPTLSENIDYYQKFYKKMLALVDISPASILGSDLAITAEMKKIADEFIQYAFMQNSPFEAVGRGLKNLCFLRGIFQKVNEHSIVLLTFSGADNLVIEKGTLVTNSITDETFTTNERGIIVNGSFSVFATSSLAGRVICDADTITITGLEGVTVNNPSDGVVGYLFESDTDLRKRLFTFVNALNIDEELYINLLNLQNVKSVKIISNPELTEDANGIPPKRTAIILLGGTESEIAREICKIIPADKKTFGDITEFVSSSVSGSAYPVSFSRPQAKEAIVNITITTDDSFDPNSEGVIRESILNYVRDKFSISDDLLIASLYIPTQQDYNSNFASFKGVKNIAITLDGSGINNKTINYNEFAILSSANLSITIN
jgi:uncharacterized phage protein gp47/JayE